MYYESRWWMQLNSLFIWSKYFDYLYANVEWTEVISGKRDKLFSGHVERIETDFLINMHITNFYPLVFNNILQRLQLTHKLLFNPKYPTESFKECNILDS